MPGELTKRDQEFEKASKQRQVAMKVNIYCMAK